MSGRNPTQVQFAPFDLRKRQLPLVLIHDGGGTTFSYFLLESLHRDVWAIHNPHFQTAEPWAGGMVEIARHYIGLMLKAGLSGPLMLGGWSLGGLLSLTISEILARNPLSRLSVAGILLIDSPHHTPWSELTIATADPYLHNIPELVQKSFDNCEPLLDTWELPPWDNDTYDGKDVCLDVSGENFHLQSGEVIYKPTHGCWRAIETRRFKQDRKPSHRAISPPPSVLIKCTQPVPAKGDTGHPCQVDLFRDEPLLGWEGNHVEFIKAVIEADAHHYNIFDLSNITQVTEQINEAMEILDSLRASEI